MPVTKAPVQHVLHVPPPRCKTRLTLAHSQTNAVSDPPFSGINSTLQDSLYIASPAKQEGQPLRQVDIKRLKHITPKENMTDEMHRGDIQPKQSARTAHADQETP